ncbi:MAG: single-stranded DNA-binding protein, partial [Myxococcales bacterium]|nr:single-stranded DNA-binding protein [Myxococcales bacterium]
MASVNKVILIGNLGKDPELRYTQSGQAVANFNIATTERFGGRDGGEMQERTEWHRIVTWGKTAENCAQYLSKGRSVYIEGRLQTRDWEDKEGNKRYTTEITALRVQFLGGREG